MTTNCQECKLPEHDREYYSWKFVTPITLSEEIRALNTDDAWNTADHVYFIERNGKIAHCKGRQATGSSTFVSFPPIPGLRLNIDDPFVTFSAEFSTEKQKELHRRLAQAVCLEIMTRADMLDGVKYESEREMQRYVSGCKFSDPDVTRILKKDQAFLENWKVVAIEQKDSKKRKIDEREKKETE